MSHKREGKSPIDRSMKAKKEVNLQKLALHLIISDSPRWYPSREKRSWEEWMKKCLARQMYKLPVAQWLEYLERECPKIWQQDVCAWLPRQRMFSNGEFIRQVESMGELDKVKPLIINLYLAGLEYLVGEVTTFTWWFERVPIDCKVKSLELLVKRNIDFRAIPADNLNEIIDYALRGNAFSFMHSQYYLRLKLFQRALNYPKRLWDAAGLLFDWASLHVGEDEEGLAELKANFESICGAPLEEDAEEDDGEEPSEPADSDGVDDWNEDSDSEFEAIPMEE